MCSPRMDLRIKLAQEVGMKIGLPQNPRDILGKQGPPSLTGTALCPRLCLSP